MKKIGIVTYHHHSNYGTMLQALALQEKIRLLGYEPEHINYVQKPPLPRRELIKLRLKRLPHYIFGYGKYKQKERAARLKRPIDEEFERFYRKYISVGARKYVGHAPLEKDPPIYDGYVVGSDQTWNPYVGRCPRGNYLTFVKDDRKKGCYAPSLPANKLTKEHEEFLGCELSKFPFLSCREKSGADMIEKITGRSVEHVLDPTLLLTSEEWDKFSTPTDLAKPYILAYLLGDNPMHRESIDKISKELGLTVIYLPISYVELTNDKIEKIFCGPDKFLSLIKGASLICTDSFHGTMFSINYNKNFYSYCKFTDKAASSENNRLYSAFEQLGLTDRLITSPEVDLSKIEIDYTRVNEKLSSLRKKSEEYLENMLKTITEDNESEKQGNKKNMIDFDFSRECYSCGLCVSACKSGAIKWTEALIPEIDAEKCVGCGACVKVCARENEKRSKSDFFDGEGLLAKNTDNEIRRKSSSGGIFYPLAKRMLDEGGYVAGCIYGDDLMPRHTVTKDEDVLHRMLGSKYVTSDMGEVVGEIEKLLKSGEKVLFSGVPCQVTSIAKRFEKYRDNLLLVSVICHGSIDPEFWRSYLNAVIDKTKTVASVTMRDKSRSWDNYGLKITYTDGTENVTYKNSDCYFLRAFTNGLFERDRCLACAYKGQYIDADIILGDGWGMDAHAPEMADSYGISSVIAITERGKEILKSLPTVTLKEIDTELIYKTNPRILSPAPEKGIRATFSSECRKSPDKINEICKKYTKPKSTFKRAIGKIMRKLGIR